MSGSQFLSPADPSAYEVIEAAVAETARGRWFLSEYARRNRNADTEVLLSAIGKLENAVSGERSLDGVGRLRGDLMEMANAIARTKAEIAAISAPSHDQSRLTCASEALDAIVRSTEQATSDILGAAEEVQELAWTLRENGVDNGLCDQLDRHATQIYTACSFQDLTAQRTSRVVHTLRYLEERLIAMIGIWGGDESVPPAPSAGSQTFAVDPSLGPLDQTDVDRFIDMESLGAEQGEAGPRAQAVVPAAAAFGTVPLHEDLMFVASPAVEETAAEMPLREAAPGEAMVEEAPDAVPADLAALEEAELPLDAEGETSAEEAGSVAVDPAFDLEPEEAFAAEFASQDESADADAFALLDEISPASQTTAEAADDAAEGEAEPAAKTAMPDFADLDELTLEEKLALFT